MTDLDWLKSLRERATEGHWTVEIYPEGAYVKDERGSMAIGCHPDGRPDEENASAIAAAVNLLGPLVEVLDHAAGMAGWADDGTYEAIKSALAAIAAERQRQEGK